MALWADLFWVCDLFVGCQFKNHPLITWLLELMLMETMSSATMNIPQTLADLDLLPICPITTGKHLKLKYIVMRLIINYAWTGQV